MGDRIFTNNANSTLAAAISSTATSLTLVSGGGSLFPSPSTGQSFSFTLVKNGTPTTFEICLCTGRTTDTFTTIARGQQGTTALSWSAGDFVYLYPTAGDLSEFAQTADLQAQSGNFAIDTGTANNYVVSLTPALTAPIEGMPIRWLAAHASTGAACTFNPGPGALEMVTQGGSVPGAGQIIVNGVYTCIYNGGGYIVDLDNLAPYLTSSAAASTYETIAAAAATYAPKANPTLTGNVVVPTLATTSNTDYAASTAFVQNLLNAFISPAGTSSKGSFTIGNTADGLIVINYGLQTTGGGGSTVITYETAFPTVCVAIVVTCVGQNATNYISDPQDSTTEFTLTNGAGGSSTSWIAIGY